MAMIRKREQAYTFVDARHTLSQVFTAYSRALLYEVPLYSSTLGVR